MNCSFTHLTSDPTRVMLLTWQQPDSTATALNKFCSICTPYGVYTEFGIDPLETVNWYLELLEVGSKKYIVPQSKAHLEMIRNQLMACHKAIMAVKITSPNDRPLLDIKYPKGYEG